MDEEAASESECYVDLVRSFSAFWAGRATRHSATVSNIYSTFVCEVLL